MKKYKELIRYYIWILGQWMSFYWRAKTHYQIANTEVVKLAKNVVDDNRMYYVFPFVRQLRKQLSNNEEVVPIEDYGAGSMYGNPKQKTISRIARESAVSEREGRILFKLVNLYQPQTILELGTSLGVSAIYQAAAMPRAHFVSIEGNTAVAQVAQKLVERAGVRVVVEAGKFENVLPQVLPEMQCVEYVYMDGDHRGEATIAYFEQILPYLKEGSVVVVGDNHWSASMLKAWQHLRRHKAVRWSVDLFDMGVLTIGEGNGETYDLITTKYKPWRGFGLS